MTVKKLAGGPVYDYLIRQVAVHDARVPAGGLTSYYAEQGEAPGTWIGAGLDGLGMSAGEIVTEAQMNHLFGTGEHPNADQLRAAAAAAGLSPAEVEAAGRLGARFRKREPVRSEFAEELVARCRAWNAAAGRPVRARLPEEVKAALRTQVGRECFLRAHGREPVGETELLGEIARWSKKSPVTVAGYDQVFSPPKSVSALWALADPQVAALIERSHQAAVRGALAYQERDALFTRTGTDGVRQVDTRGMIAAAFVHRDSRAGDPDLHTHVAVANKVQSLDGRWLAIDGRTLFKSHVATSETYDALLRAHLTETLGVGWVARPSRNGRRPVWEIDGIDPTLCSRWSSRRVDIEAEAANLATKFRTAHGRPPTGLEMIHLAQQANLATRDPKHEPRTLAEQRATWRAQADQHLGPQAVDQMLRQALTPRSHPAVILSPEWLEQLAASVTAEVEASRATWQGWHVRAEALRQLAGLGLAPEQIEPVVDHVVDLVLHTNSFQLDLDDPVTAPEALRRRDGHSVYELAGATTYSSGRIIAAEKNLLATAQLTTGRRIDPQLAELALLESVANGTSLNEGQARLVRELATSGRQLQLALAPAGTGKTTALEVLANAWTSSGGTIVGLAPSAAAAHVLAEHLGTAPCDTLAKLVDSLDHPDRATDWTKTITRDTLVLIDEAGMADTPTLDRIVTHVTALGGSVRLIGDDHQLSAVAAGGILTDLAHTDGTIRLEEVLRFSDPAEAAASLALRTGNPAAIAFYADNGRLHPADAASITSQMLDSWTRDRQAGLDAIMLAPTRDLVAQLNHHARTLRLNGTAPGREIALADGNRASAGDVIITRRNNRALRTRNGNWLTNGDRWTIQRIHSDGSLTAADLTGRRHVRLPADYVEAWTELGYATTIHTAQGVTADTCHTLITGDETRQQLYTAASRGRHANHLHITVAGDGLPDPIDYDTLTIRAAEEVLEHVLAHDETALSASSHQRQAHDPASQLAPAVGKYLDGLGAACEHHLGPDKVKSLDEQADQIVLWLTSEPAWPTLRAHLLQIAATGTDPIAVLRDAANTDSLDGAHDAAAVLDWRIDPTRHLPVGPLPWLPGIPHQLTDDPVWGPYLSARADQLTQLAGQLRHPDPEQTPAWQTRLRLPDQLAADLLTWRTANSVPDHDLRPTGPPATTTAGTRWQHQLDHRLTDAGMPDITPWWPQLQHLARHLAGDPALPLLAAHLEEIQGLGGDAAAILDQALHDGPVHVRSIAATLEWRVHRHDYTSEHITPTREHATPRRPPPPVPGINHHHDRGIPI